MCLRWSSFHLLIVLEKTAENNQNYALDVFVLFGKIFYDGDNYWKKYLLYILDDAAKLGMASCISLNIKCCLN